MNISDIRTASPFKDLFPIRNRTLDDITWDMRRYGFDIGKPLVLWKDHDNLLVDGHTRLQAAKRAGLCNVPIIFKAFKNEDAALKYAVKCQQHRRNLTDAELFACVLELSRKRNGHYYEESSGEIAVMLGANKYKVERMRVIIKHAPGDIINMLKRGRMSVTAAYNRCLPSRIYQAGTQSNDLEQFCSIISRRFNPEQIDTIIEKLTRKERCHVN